ncbi:PREDICTED: protein SMG5-like [Chinchilla lanigera]|uniref:protein SMG5-like n=1 Tax=Chinchilla lanigera TaxID=34839 RepID=UPI000698C6D8|nr:PREDICTED: protein SMG5-like [Chinchilla lanigera]XP_013368147.1 PREDICTED: protein SMG5-like [Chinchilla lanigera]XP_013368148.1 PREDICTED: protein SMG5-like [Chinchilla lanigera]XP_013368149.1 PREDICTED: protein SMG5-like [Chinchilla lanigera]
MSQICSEANGDTSCSDISDEEEGGFLKPEAIQKSGAMLRYEADQAQKKMKAFKPSNSVLEPFETTISANLSMPLNQKLPGTHGSHLAPVFSPSKRMPPSELSPDSDSASSTEDNVSSFPDTEFHVGSLTGQGASVSQSPSHLEIIQRKLKVLSAEGLLPTLKVILGWLCANHHLLTSWQRSPLSLWDHLCVLLNLLPSVGELQQPGLGLFHYVYDLLLGCQGPQSPMFPQLPADIALFQYCPPQASQVRVGSQQAPPALSTQDEAAVPSVSSKALATLLLDSADSS